MFMFVTAGIEPGYAFLVLPYIYVCISITSRYGTGLYQYVLCQLVSVRVGIKPDSTVLYVSNKPFYYKVLRCILYIVYHRK